MSFHVSEGGLEGLLPSPRGVHRRPRVMATSSVTALSAQSPSTVGRPLRTVPKSLARGYKAFPAPIGRLDRTRRFSRFVVLTADRSKVDRRFRVAGRVCTVAQLLDDCCQPAVGHGTPMERSGCG